MPDLRAGRAPMVTHYCYIERALMEIEVGAECNWCGVLMPLPAAAAPAEPARDTRVRLVEVVHENRALKRTWYRVGERHFVTIDPDYPATSTRKYAATHINGGIHENDCIEIGGAWAGIKCWAFGLRRRWQIRRSNARFERVLREAAEEEFGEHHGYAADGSDPEARWPV